MATALSSLAAAFAGNDPTFVVDRIETVRTLSGWGVPAVDLDSARLAPPDNIVLVLQDELTSKADDLRLLRGSFAGSRVMTVPVRSFDESQAATEYTIGLLLRSDFLRATERAGRWRQVLARLPSPLEFVHPSRPECRLTCHLDEDIKLLAAEDPVIQPGAFRSATAYFEIEMEALDESARFFSVAGQLPASGLLAARHADMPSEFRHLHAEGLAMVSRYARAAAGGVLHLRDNRVESLVVDGEDWTPELFRVAGGAGECRVLEFSIGINSLDGIDWSVNSCLNEGIQGVHVAAGNGSTGAHLDFVGAGMQLVLREPLQ